MPPVRILDNMQLEPNDYKIRIKEIEVGDGAIYPSLLMVMDPEGQQITLPGEHTTEPAFGLPATWIDPSLRDEAEIRGYSIIDPSTVISTHLTEVLKANVADLLSYAGVQSLLKNLTSDQQKLVEDIVPLPDLGHRYPARAAIPAQRARVDPRLADDSGRHCRGRRHRPLAADDGRARAHAPFPPALCRQSWPGRHAAHPHPVARLGARFRRGHAWRRQRTSPRHGAVQAAAVHRLGAGCL